MVRWGRSNHLPSAGLPVQPWVGLTGLQPKPPLPWVRVVLRRRDPNPRGRVQPDSSFQPGCGLCRPVSQFPPLPCMSKLGTRDGQLTVWPDIDQLNPTAKVSPVLPACPLFLCHFFLSLAAISISPSLCIAGEGQSTCCFSQSSDSRKAWPSPSAPRSRFLAACTPIPMLWAFSTICFVRPIVFQSISKMMGESKEAPRDPRQSPWNANANTTFHPKRNFETFLSSFRMPLCYQIRCCRDTISLPGHRGTEKKQSRSGGCACSGV